MSRNNLKSLSYVLGVNGQDESHVLPINSIKSNETHMFTGGRDGVIACYDENIQVQSHIQLHTDWVNDIELLDNENVVSCSSDLSVKVWNYLTRAYDLIGHHRDYVKALTVCNAGLVITGGLDRFVNVWDVQKRAKVSAYENDLDHDKGSIYALDSNKSTGIVAFGDNASNIILFDPKSSKSICALPGHKDIVKSIIVGGNYLLSGSSDDHANLWDLRANKILKNYNFETPVWSLYSNDDNFNDFYTGDSKGRLYHTSQDITNVIGHQKRGILSINKFQNEIWSSSMKNSDLKNWTDSSKAKKGEPGMIKARLLSNRRYVVTLSTSDEVKLWDIVKCVELKNFGSDVGFEDVIEKYQTNEILPSWCRVTVKAGRLFIILSEAIFSNTEVYGDDIDEYGLNLDHETRYSLGKIVLVSIFHKLLEYEQNKDNKIRESRVKELKGSSKLHILSKLSTHENTPSHSNPHSQLNSPIDEYKGYFNDKLTDTLNALPPSSAPAVLQDCNNENHKKEESATPSKNRRLKLFSRKSSKNQHIPISVESGDSDSTHSQVPSTAPSTTGNDTGTSKTHNQVDFKSSSDSEPSSTDNNRKPSNVQVEDSFQSVLNDIKAQYDTFNHAGQLHVSYITPPPKYEVPLIELPHDLIIIINFKICGSSNEIDLYTEFLSSLNYQTLEQLLPKWIGNFILRNKVDMKDFSKIGFVVSKHPDATDIPSMIVDECRLNAYNMLRVKRILTYVVDRLASKVPEISHHINPEDWLEVVCNGKVIPNSMTLATLKATIWKSSGDIQVSYRRKCVK